MNTHASCANNGYQAIAVSSVEKTDGKSIRAAQEMLQGKIYHEQIRTSRLTKT